MALATELNTLRQRLVDALSDQGAGRGTLRASRIQYSALHALARLGERRRAHALLLTANRVELRRAQVKEGDAITHNAHLHLGDVVERGCLHTSSSITSLNGHTVRCFPTHGQLSAAQGSPTTVSA